jgi:hypothetical protein
MYMPCTAARGGFLLFAGLLNACCILGSLSLPAQTAAHPPGPTTKPESSIKYETGKLVEVRQSIRGGYLVSRYSSVHIYTMYFTVRTSEHSYCVDYDTPILDEVNDLLSANGKEVQVEVRGKKGLTLMLPSKRQIKADLANSTQC